MVKVIEEFLERYPDWDTQKLRACMGRVREDEGLEWVQPIRVGELVYKHKGTYIVDPEGRLVHPWHEEYWRFLNAWFCTDIAMYLTCI